MYTSYVSGTLWGTRNRRMYTQPLFSYSMDEFPRHCKGFGFISTKVEFIVVVKAQTYSMDTGYKLSVKS